MPAPTLTYVLFGWSLPVSHQIGNARINTQLQNLILGGGKPKSIEQQRLSYKAVGLGESAKTLFGTTKTA